MAAAAGAQHRPAQPAGGGRGPAQLCRADGDRPPAVPAHLRGPRHRAGGPA